MKAKRLENERLTIRHLHQELVQLKQEMEKIMAAIDNLNTAVQGLQTTVTAVQTVVTSLKNQPNNDVQIQAAADAINTATASLNDAIK